MKEIETTTIYTEENVKEFYEVYFYEKIRIIRVVINILALISVIAYFTKSIYLDIDTVSLVFILICVIELNTSIFPKVYCLFLFRKKNNIIGTKVGYTFKKNNFKYNNGKDSYLDYSSLKKVIETDNSYYLYIDNSISLIVDKKSLSDKDIAIITANIKEKVSTYKYKKYV